MALPVNPGAPARNDALLAEGDGCYHCGEQLPADPARFELDGIEREFCCDGCAAAAQWIRDAHLGDYYRLRSDHASRVGTAPVDLAVWDRDELLAEHAHASTVPRVTRSPTACLRRRAWLIDLVLARETACWKQGPCGHLPHPPSWDPARPTCPHLCNAWSRWLRPIWPVAKPASASTAATQPRPDPDWRGRLGAMRR